MTKIGICFGGYCPMHRGHLDAIMRAKKENDKCFVIVCGYDNEERAGNINMTLKERTAIVRKIFANDEIINVLSINDTQLGIDESMCDNNWVIWQKEVMRQLKITPSHDGVSITWYVAEPYYKEMLEKHNLLNAHTILIDKVVPVSGTYIRQNPIKYWKYIVREYRNNLCHNILITGTASEGKTTLVRDISTYFGIQHSEEFGRDDLLNKGKVDTDLTADDFVDFLVGQSLDMRKRVFNNDNGVFISDTDNLVTLMYALAYVDDPNVPITKEEYENKVLPVAKSLEGRVKWDKIFLLPPKNKFVDDGSRYMKQASIDERIANFNKLTELLRQFGLWDKVEILDGSFLTNFSRVKDYINSVYDE
jgi:NadR type nicotinamide-nucleotide adenylyltransferase